MSCPQCDHYRMEGANFCSSCGARLNLETSGQEARGPEASEPSLRGVMGNIADQINRAAGVSTPTELKLREVFSRVFAKHTEEEAERLFFVGTTRTTPGIWEVAETWPKPWLFARVFALVALLYFGLYIGVEQFHNINFLPGLITMGSFAVPFTILIFFWEMNAPRNISIYQVIKMLFVGGVLSLVAAVFIFDQIGNQGSVVIIGLVEEAAKVLVILWFLRKQKYPYILNGLLIGSAIGAGFAAFESAGYALRMALYGDMHTMYTTIFWRGVLAPGGHIVWAALSGAALCMVKGDQPFAWSMLKDLRFLRMFGIVALLHALWDMPWFTSTEIPFLQLLLMLISWVIAFAVMGAGLKEISNLKRERTTRYYTGGSADSTVNPSL
ncbi:PrsW family intramembrane metalloprotease [Paenibacillus sp. CAA11]|uniref:PrsW family glutamic-type intramembrane protease n=1 Tax=Paenibacillus sp. CAA11 TaxID=1532905 RepID=UPI000D3987E0|nr:PrsW family glutamic-type intramembrane protease [Paenibacillus sp. CAA11]AWB46389.1 PrsW family intramembrane metalloprotease [Paenibacillus sp. CAA11]